MKIVETQNPPIKESEVLVALEKNQQPWKPHMQSLYIDLLQDQNANARAIHLGFKAGATYTLAHLKKLENYGVNHVIINLKYSTRPVKEVIEELGQKILNYFN